MARPSTSLPALAPHFHLPPAHTHPQSSAQSLERRLLGGEAGGKMRNGVAPTAAVDDLLVGEDAPQEPLIPALNDLTHSRDQRQIHADAHDVHAQQDAIRPAVDRAAAVLLAPGPRMPHCCSCSTGRHSPRGGSRRHGPVCAGGAGDALRTPCVVWGEEGAPAPPAQTRNRRVTVRSPRKSSPPARRRYSRRAPAPPPRP